MTSTELKTILGALDLNQIDFARLIGVTPRAVSLWMTGDRSVSGPAVAYARLLNSLPASLRQVELARLKERKTAMRDGLYALEFKSVDGAGTGILILENGRAYGADPWGCKYDGDFTADEATGVADLRLKLTFAPNAPAVFGVSHPYEWSIDVTAKLDTRRDTGRLRVNTPIGEPIDVKYQFMRALPDA
jgi:transcriptional regulator with XRE-family HTH domain